MNFLERLAPREILSGFLAVSILAIPREYLKAWIALLLGDDTPKKAGRLSLNPLVHLDPIGTAAFILFDFGWTRPVPIRPWKMKKHGLLIVSISGPALNIMEAVIFAGITKNLLRNSFAFDVFYKSTLYSFTYSVFSLFPIPPLDGSKILEALLPERYSSWIVKYEVYGTLFLLALLVLWILPLMMDPFVNMINSFVSSMIGI